MDWEVRCGGRSGDGIEEEGGIYEVSLNYFRRVRVHQLGRTFFGFPLVGVNRAGSNKGVGKGVGGVEW